MALPVSRRDLMWTAIVAASFVCGLAVSWHRWANPLIDCGREMNQPLRLLQGETLYSDVRHIYGPLSPYVHAGLFRIFGPSLNVLYADGMLSAAGIIALVYWLSRRIMAPFQAATATLSVTWLCAFKPAGNYVMPYSFGALHGTLLGLASLSLLVPAIENPTRSGRGRILLAGTLAGLALLAKTEMGLAALAAGIAASTVSGSRRRGALGQLFLFALPALAVPALVYGWLLATLGWQVIVTDSWLLWLNVPAPLAHYNAWVSGLDRPVRSVTRMVIAAAKMGALAAILAAASHLLSRRGPHARPAASPSMLSRVIIASPTRALVSASVVLAALAASTGFDWDKGPYLAMPFLLVGLAAGERRRLDSDDETSRGARLLVVYAVFALASVARMILHVRSGGAYGSFLLPMSVVLFTYAWAVPFGDWLESAGAGRAGATLALALLLVDVGVTAGIIAHRYRTRYATPIRSARGEMYAERDVGQAWNEALAFIEARTPPNAFVSVMPEGTSLDFLSRRQNPLREEIATPGYFADGNEGRAIRQLAASEAPIVMITNRSTGEFGPTAFGRDYAVEMMRYIESRYELCGVFGAVKDASLQVADRQFFVKAYCRR